MSSLDFGYHADLGLLRSAYSWLKRDAAPGIDGMTWQECGEGLERKLAHAISEVQLLSATPQFGGDEPRR